MFKFLLVLLLTPTLLLSQVDFNQINKNTDKLINNFLKSNQVPGISISVSYNDSVYYSKGFGYSDIDKKIKVCPSKTKFRIGSITKTITSLTLAKLVELDSIQLNQNVEFYLDSLPKMKYRFTIKELGGHLTGLPRNPTVESFDCSNIYKRKEFYNLLVVDTLNFIPSSKFYYSNYGFKMLGLVIEKEYGKSITISQKELILDKLKMYNTVPDINVYDANTTIFYTKLKDTIIKAPCQDCHFKYSEGCYLSTSEDLIKLGNGILYHNILNSSIAKTFIESQKLEDNTETDYGIGFVSKKDKYKNFYFGHDGKFIGGSGMLRIYPKSGLVISILANFEDLNYDNILSYIAKNYINEINRTLSFKEE